MVFVDINGDPLGEDLSAHVLWDVTGAITLGAASTAIGKMEASGAITVGAGAEAGSLTSTGGAITLGASAVCGTLRAVGAITLGAGAVTQSIDSDAAVTLGAGAYAVGSLAADLGGMTLVPGTYTATAAVGLTGTLILDTTGITTPVWRFEISAAFTTAAASEMKIIGPNANAAKVEWVVGGAITLGASSFAIGTMNTKAAITVGASATCGSLVAGGAVTVGAGTRYVSADGTAVTLGAGATPIPAAGLGLA
jgi:hypothetical protein